MDTAVRLTETVPTFGNIEKIFHVSALASCAQARGGLSLPFINFCAWSLTIKRRCVNLIPLHLYPSVWVHNTILYQIQWQMNQSPYSSLFVPIQVDSVLLLELHFAVNSEIQRLSLALTEPAGQNRGCLPTLLQDSLIFLVTFQNDLVGFPICVHLQQFQGRMTLGGTFECHSYVSSPPSPGIRRCIALCW